MKNKKTSKRATKASNPTHLYALEHGFNSPIWELSTFVVTKVTDESVWVRNARAKGGESIELKRNGRLPSVEAHRMYRRKAWPFSTGGPYHAPLWLSEAEAWEDFADLMRTRIEADERRLARWRPLLKRAEGELRRLGKRPVEATQIDAKRQAKDLRRLADDLFGFQYVLEALFPKMEYGEQASEYADNLTAMADKIDEMAV